MDLFVNKKWLRNMYHVYIGIRKNGFISKIIQGIHCFLLTKDLHFKRRSITQLESFGMCYLTVHLML